MITNYLILFIKAITPIDVRFTDELHYGRRIINNSIEPNSHNAVQQTNDIANTNNVLLLGMTRLQLDTNNWDVHDVINSSTMKCIDITYQRDLGRIVRMEKLNCGLTCYSVSLQTGVNTHKDRHLNFNMNSRSFVDSLVNKFSNVHFFQICLDYFWSPLAWQTERWTVGLMDNIIALANQQILRRSNAWQDDFSNGSVMLPFSFHIVQLMLLRKNHLEKYYKINYLSNQKDMSYNLLWKSTSTIEDTVMGIFFGKKNAQENEYCQLTLAQVSQGSILDGLDRDTVMNYIRTIPSLDRVRFICFTLHT